MTTKDFTANVISATKVVPDGNFKDSKASGIWDINEALDLIKGGNWPSTANINPSAFVGALFQTHLYIGTAADLTITNNIDLSGKGGLVWTKKRDESGNHHLFDTERGVTKRIRTNTSAAESSNSEYLKTFNSDGFTIGSSGNNNNTYNYVSWTFRKQPKFFDVQTWTGDADDNRTISHSLNAVPGMIIVKRLDGASDFITYNSNGSIYNQMVLNSTAANNSDKNFSQIATTSVLKIGHIGGTTDVGNKNNETYVAYLFAHNNNDGGFGEPGDQDIIKCGSYSGDGNATGPVIDLGFEPQFLMIKRAVGGTGGWFIFDAMRGIITGGNDNTLQAEANSAEGTGDNRILLTPTGFQLETTSSFFNDTDSTYVYMAIRRGGMQTPTAASDVFNVDIGASGTADDALGVTTGFPVDMFIHRDNYDSGGEGFVLDRVRGRLNQVDTTSAGDEGNYSTNNPSLDSNAGLINRSGSSQNLNGGVYFSWKRARGYFDIVAFAGSGSNRNISHNLGVAPEMMWIKCRSSNSRDWEVYHTGIGETKFLRLNTNEAEATSSSRFNNTAPTSTVFRLGNNDTVNGSGDTYISYHFATVAGVSKVGSFTQSGATNVACGFTGSTPALIIFKRTDATGNWYKFNSDRGIVAGNDPHFYMDTTAAEITNADMVDPYSGGFATTSNIADGDYIFYAIASIA